MGRFVCRVARVDGTIGEETIDAENEAAVRDLLEHRNRLVFSIRPEQFIRRSIPVPRLSRRTLRPAEFLVFNQEFITLLKAGLPIIKTLELLAERAPGAFRDVLGRVRDAIRGGASIAEALSAHPTHFPELYVASVRAGERSGNLTEILSRYVAYYRRVLAVRKKIVQAIAYPGFLLAVGFAVIGFLLLYVLPTFAQVYAEAQKDLPALTRVLLGVVRFLRSQLVFMIAAAVGLVWAVRAAYRSAWGRRLADRLFLRLPGWGPLIRRHHAIRIARTLATILGGGIPLVPALEMVSDATPNTYVRGLLDQVRERVKEGAPLARSLDQTRIFPRMSTEMIAVGEGTGALEEMLAAVADFHEEELDVYLARLVTWVEPALLLMIGGMVAMIIVAMYLPIFNLAGAIQ